MFCCNRVVLQLLKFTLILVNFILIILNVFAIIFPPINFEDDKQQMGYYMTVSIIIFFNLIVIFGTIKEHFGLSLTYTFVMLLMIGSFYSQKPFSSVWLFGIFIFIIICSYLFVLLIKIVKNKRSVDIQTVQSIQSTKSIPTTPSCNGNDNQNIKRSILYLIFEFFN